MAGVRARCATCLRQFRIPAGTTETRCTQCRSGAVTPLRPSAPTPVQAVAPTAGEVEASMRRALSAAGREATPLGMVTLKLAREFDAAEGVAAQRIAEGLRKSLAEALEGAAPPADALDDLRRRREAKAAGA